MVSQGEQRRNKVILTQKLVTSGIKRECSQKEYHLNKKNEYNMGG